MKNKVTEMEKSVSRIKHNNNVIIKKNLTLEKQKEKQFENLEIHEIEELISRYENKVSELPTTDDEADVQKNNRLENKNENENEPNFQNEEQSSVYDASTNA